MPRTSTRVSFGLFALEIKQDSNPYAAGLQPFSKIKDLKTDSATSRPYATWEPDFWLLDGQYKFLPDDHTTVHVGLMSQAMSGVDGIFAVPPVLTVNFQQVHDTDGFSIRFSLYTGDYANRIRVAFYNSANALIREDEYFPTGVEFSTNTGVVGFKKIVVTFYGTNRPQRYLRVSGIDYGQLISFEGSGIKSCYVIEQKNQLSSEIPIGTMDLQLYSKDAQFSIINPQGYFAALKERQPLAVYETVDNATIFIGQFYLDEWENISDTESLFHAVDLLGVIDRMTCMGGLWNGIAVETIIEQLLGPIFVPYELDPDLYGVIVKGWIPVCTYRQALQQIGLAVGASVSCTRSGAIRIMKTRIAADQDSGALIAKSQKGSNQRLSLLPLVTSTEVVSHDYVVGTVRRDLFNGELPVGQHVITFSQPCSDFQLTGATAMLYFANYAKINVTSPGTVVLTGIPYTDTTAVTQINTLDLPSGVRPNVLRIPNATLVGQHNVQSVAQRIHNYFQQRYKQEMKLFAPSVEVGETVVVETLYDKQIRGIIERMDLDLARGFTAQTEVIGVENVD